MRVSASGADDATPTGADGVFRLTGVKPGPAVKFWLTRDDYSPATNQPVPVLADQATSGVTLRMVKQAHVRGTLTAASGAALVDARVLVSHRTDDQDNPWNEQWRWQNALRVPVKPDGTFDAAISFAPPGKIVLRATARDQAQTDSKPLELVEGRDFYDVDVVLPDGTDLSGKVVAKEGGAAIEGARVSVTPRRSGNDQRMYGQSGQYPVWAVTDATGAFRVAHLNPGPFDVRASAEGFVAEVAAAEPGPDRSVTLELQAESTIEGVVSYADGRPAEGVEIQAVQSAQQQRVFGSMIEQQTSALTDAKGAFRCQGLGAGRYALDVRPPWGSNVNVRATRVEGVAAGTKDVKVTVEAGGSISGRVLDSKRAPVPSAYVMANPVPRDGKSMSGNVWRNTQAKPDGTFVLTGLVDEPHRLQISVHSGGSGFRPVVLEKVEVGTKDLEVLMQEGASISGVVVDANGNGLGQVPVQAQPEQQADGRMAGNAWTDSAGKFTISGLAPGSYRIELPNWGGSNQGWVLAESTSAVPTGTSGLRLVAGKGVTISGVVLDEAGKPVLGATLQVLAPKGSNDNSQHRWAQTREDGAFDITGLESGRSYGIHAQAQGRINAQVEDVAAGTKDVRIVLAKGLEVSGRLTDAGGKPVSSTHISFSHEDRKHTQYAQTDAEGRFATSGFVDGTYEARVYVQKEGKGEWKPCGSVKGGDAGVELRVSQ